MQKEIENLYITESKKLPELRKRFQEDAVRWIYSKKQIWSYDEKLKDSGSDILQGPKGARYACGFDKEDRPIVQTGFEYDYSKGLSTRPNTILSDEFITYHCDKLEVYDFLRDELRRLYQVTFKDGLISEVECVQEGYYTHTFSHYTDRKLVLDKYVDKEDRVIRETEYRDNDEAAYFKIRADGTRFQLYQPLPKGVTLKSVKETISSRLLTLIPELVVSAGIKEPIYCIALAYDAEGDAMPPVIGIGLESERERWLTEKGKDARHWIWNPAEFYHYEKDHTQFEDEKLEEACDQLNSKLAENDSQAPAIKLLVNVAAKLNAIPWPKQIQRTPDFVVYAVDFELADLRKHLKAILPPERFTEMKAKKLF